MKTKEKGDLAVAKAINYFIEQGFEVLLPIGDKQKYDLVVDDGNILRKVQCKFTSSKSKYGIYVANTCVCGGNTKIYNRKEYKDGDFDLYFVLTSEGSIYLLPSEEVIGHKVTINLGAKYSIYRIS